MKKTKNFLFFFFILFVSITSIMKVDAYVPVTYTCCYDYTYSDGVKIDGFEAGNGWVGTSQEADTIHFKEGQQGLKLIAKNGNTVYTDLAINKDFSNVNNVVIWVYVDNASNYSQIYIYLTSTGPSWNKYFSDKATKVRTGWNKFVFNKHSFKNNFGEDWNNIMNRIRLRIYPSTGKNLNVTFDDLRNDMTGQRAKIMIEFDDGKYNNYQYAYPIMNANNQPGVSYVVSSYVESTDPDYMRLSNLRTLQSAGWDISSHTVNHVNLATATSSTQTSEINGSYDWLVANKFQKSAGFIAYPFGYFNDAVLDKVEKRYVLGRAAGSNFEGAQQHFTQDPDDPIRYIQRIIEIYNTSTVQWVKDNINDTINAKLLGVLVFHGIVESNPGTYDYSTTDLQKISDYIKSRSSDIDVITNSDYVIPNIKNFTPVLNKTTRIYSNGSSVLITKNKYDEYMPNMTVKPLSDSIDIGITTHNENGGIIKFNESSSNPNLQVSYEIGDRIPNQIYSVKIYWANGIKYQDFNLLANSTGYISYNSQGFGNSRYQEINTNAPSIISWGNNKTNDNTLSLTISTSESIQFNATANQNIDTWNWFRDDVNQNNNFDNFTTSFATAGIHTIKVNATNQNGTSSTVTWTITVPVAYWKFDENTGTTASDSSGNGNNGIINGGATWTTGKIGYALSFDGVNDYVDAGNTASLQITGAISLEGWIKINDLSVSSSLFGRGHGLGSNDNYGYFLTYYAPTNRLYFDTYSTTTRDALSKTNAINDSNWHHIAATWDGTTSANGKKLYIDGVLVAQKTSTIDSMGNPSFNFRIGRDSLNYRPARATIDEVKVYNRALSASDVLADYNAGSSGFIPPTISSWSNNKTNDASLDIMANVSEIIRFNATANQIIDTWKWFKDDVDQTNNFDNLSYQFASAGIHTIKVNATNQNGTSSTVTWTVTVQGPTGAPAAPDIISWSNNKTNNNTLSLIINTSESVQFNATANQSIDTWNWFKDDIDQNNNFDIFTTSFATTGIHTIKVNATNLNGTSSTVTWTVEVTEVNPVPNASAIISWGNNKTNNDSLTLIINTSEAVNFNVTANQTITMWNWYKDDINQNNNYDNFSTSWDTSGTKNVKVNATNPNGTSSTVTWTVTVQEPTGAAGAPDIISWSNNKTNDASLDIMANVSETIRFNATANQSIDTWKWFLDNVDQNNNFDNLDYQFGSAGTYTVKVNASNTNGTSNTVMWNINVQAPDTNLIAFWKFDENTGTTASDSSGNNNTGTLINGPVWIAGKIGNALQFDGVNDYVDAGNKASLQITEAISLEGWVKINDLSVSSSLFGRGHGLGSNVNNGYFLTYYAPTKSLYFDTYNTTKRDILSKTNAINDSNWHHIAATWDGTTSANGKKLYIDGVLVAQKTSTIDSMGNPSFNFRIGIDSLNYRPARATIDEVKVYNRALSASEVLADMGG